MDRARYNNPGTESFVIYYFLGCCIQSFGQLCDTEWEDKWLGRGSKARESRLNHALGYRYLSLVQIPMIVSTES